MIVVTGAAGFIGSVLISNLEKQGYGELVAVDDFSNPEKIMNLEGKKLKEKVHRDDFLSWLDTYGEKVQFVHHIGARTDTAEFDTEILNRLNLEYSKQVWNLCCSHSIPLIYASSAATYGDGAHGFDDAEQNLEIFEPLNPYGWSKHAFDIWVRDQSKHPPFWAGFKFFNVFGPNEWHKKRMASVIMHAYNQIQETGKVKLFRSHRSDFADGMQQRDFVYVMDVVQVLVYFMEHRKRSGLYNLGTGKCRTFMDLALAVFSALQIEPNIDFVDIPEDIRNRYQYFTEANMAKIKDAGYTETFTELEDSVKDYVIHYLSTNKSY